MKLGGAEKHVIRLASGLRKRGYEAGIATIFREGVLAEEAREQGIPFTCLGANDGWGPGTLVRIFNWLRLSRPDVLHTYLFGFHFFAGFPARLLGVPFILSSRREMAHWQKARHLFLENLGNLFVDRVVCCSGAVRERTLAKERISSERVQFIYNGVDCDQFGWGREDGRVREEFGIPENALVVATVANFAIEKGYPYLLEAARIVLEEIPEARFLLVGSGPLEKEIKEKARRIPQHEQIIFTGARHNVPEVLAATDLFVLASLWEGFPNVLLEATAMGKPVVATRVGGIPELIKSDQEGSLVPPKNAGALAGAIVSLLRDPEKGREMAIQARKKIREKFSLERMIDDYEALYLSLVS
jgi:glycosyltransferase involved in cell wall biosynthesis